MRLLWERFEDTGAGLPDEAFKSAVLDIGTGEMAVWVERYLETTRPIEWERHLAPVGLELLRSGAGATPYMGIMRREQGDRVIVSQVRADGPNGGGELYAGDEIAAINGHQATSGSWKNMLKLVPMEGEVEMTVFRRRELMTIQVKVVPHPGRPKLVELDNATDGQIERRKRWLGP
jgi:predicted metalloprotease with PDZ domain